LNQFTGWPAATGDPWLAAGLLFAAGLVAGLINVVAGGGSFLTLPILIFLGLPPNAANHTNRIGIFMQNAGAVWGFHRHKVLGWEWLQRAALPATLGSGVGAWLALNISDSTFQRTLALLMVAISLWTLWDPVGRSRAGRAGKPANPWAMAALFFAVGIYGGFIQAGVGFFLLAATTMAGLDLVRGNAVKVLCALAFTTLSLAIFVWQGTVYWPAGLSLGAGTLIGGQVGVHLTVLKGHRWIRGVVTVMVLIFAVRLWWTS
jgi:uncharacterized membrane protein YfcA